MISVFHQINAIDWGALSDMLDERGYALTSQIVAPEHCRQLADLYDHTQQFRSTVIMARDGFGRGEYRYFGYPLPSIVATLREVLYPHLAAIASRWSERLGTVDI